MSIISNNKTAINVIAWLTLPSGILLIIGLSSLLESIGIAVFYSGLFVRKLAFMSAKIGIDAQIVAGIISFVLGLILAILNSVGVMVLRLIGQVTWSKIFGLVFLGLAVFSYYNTIQMDTARGFNYALLFGVFFMVLVPSVLVNVLSSYLAVQIINTDWFSQMTDEIYQRASGRKQSALSDLIVNRSGRLSKAN